jgi:hypothetical protein
MCWTWRRRQYQPQLETPPSPFFSTTTAAQAPASRRTGRTYVIRMCRRIRGMRGSCECLQGVLSTHQVEPLHVTPITVISIQLSFFYLNPLILIHLNFDACTNSDHDTAAWRHATRPLQSCAKLVFKLDSV